MHHPHGRQIVDVLLVEDNPSDVRIVRAAVQEGRFPVELHLAYTAQEAIDFVARAYGAGTVSEPRLILLDLLLGDESGFEVLRALKSSPLTRWTPVLVYTGVPHPSDITRAYQMGAASVILKDFSMDQNVSNLCDCLYYWIYVATLPPRRRRLGAGDPSALMYR